MRSSTGFEDEDKPENPRRNANWCSILSFFYTIPIFQQGRKRDFDENDLTKPLEEHKSSILGDKLAIVWSQELERAKLHHEIPSFSRCIVKCFYKDILMQGTVLFIMELLIRIYQPLFLGLLLRYFNPNNAENKIPPQQPRYLLRLFYFWTPNQTAIDTGEAYTYVTGIFLVNIINVMVLHPSMMAIMHVGMKLRVASCSLIYRKALRLDLASLSGSTVGNVVNLISNDVNRFDLALLYLHYIWIAPLQMILCLYFMYREVNISAVVGIAAILGLIPLQAWFGNRTSRFRLKTAIRSDERIRQMNEIIQGMQVIKMYTWEYAFGEKVHELRRSEIQMLKQTNYIRGAIASFLMFTSRFCIFLTILSYVVRGESIEAEKVFVVTSFYNILRQTMTAFFPHAIAQLAETHVAISRIKRFLLMPECKKENLSPLIPNHQIQKDDEFSYSSVEKGRTERFDQTPKIIINNVITKIGEEVCLENISLEIREPQLIAVIGMVGSGKSALLNLILGEMQPSFGKIRVDGVISYASQEPWLFDGSVRQNILFGREYERKRYREVIRVCALIRDFQILPFGDRTIVGEKGASLSGGQRARINLARAVYKKADIYLLDDPLSAVDANVGKHLFDHCISQYLSGKIVILVTHQLQFLTDIQRIILIDNGSISIQGSYKSLEASGFEYSETLKDQMPVDVDPLDLNSKRVESIMKDLTIRSSFSMNIIDIEGQKYKPQQEAEIRTQGSVECHLYEDYFTAGGNCLALFGMFLLFILTQVLASGGDYFLSEWTNTEEIRSHPKSDNSTLPFWGAISTNISIAIYTVLIMLTIVVALIRSFVYFSICMRASVNLHDRMFNSIIKASMKFFNTNTSGRILNRFSKDLGAIDELLPVAMIDFAQLALNAIGIFIVIAVVNFYLLILTGVLIIFFYFLRNFYLRTSRSVKRLEGISRSPVFSHLNATLQGLDTIRSNGAEMILTKEFDRFQDDHSSAWFMFIATSRAFGFWTDFICSVYIGGVSYSFLLCNNVGSKVGLAITQAIGMSGTFQWCLKQSAEMENQMTSVERVLEFTKVEHEPDLESTPDKKPPPEWPSDGRIEFQNLVMRYKPNDPPVLKSLNFTVQPKEKIGIVGRTGAGKSSLIAALFRLSPFEGSVVVDGVDTTKIGLHDLRRKISIIPQEPVLFSGTLRYNMDPFNRYDDDSIVAALLVVETKLALSEGAGCLSHHVSEGGVNISVGERQMICLARAILRNNVVLVLDEATANVDPKTDRFIQTTIREKFVNCTVLTIAHRLHTIMDSDRVLVIDAGFVVEFDHPHILLQNENGSLTKMVKKTGKSMSQNLRKIAKESYQSIQKGQS